MDGPGEVWATLRPLLACQFTALNTAVGMSWSAKGTSSEGATTVPAGRPGASGLVTSSTPSCLAALRASSRSQVAPPNRLVTESSSPPAGASRSIMPMVARRSTSLSVSR